MKRDNEKQQEAIKPKQVQEINNMKKASDLKLGTPKAILAGMNRIFGTNVSVESLTTKLKETKLVAKAVYETKVLPVIDTRDNK